MPWALLPGLSGRAVSVTTSVTAGDASLGDRRLDHGHGVLAVAGTGRAARGPGGVARWPRFIPAATLLTGPAATGRAVLDAMPAGGLVHIAAHGQHEQDNPLFSGVLLADGLLYGYDVAPNPALPAHVVLSSCDVGRTDDRPGGEPLGLVAALLRSGVSTVVAGTSRISDSVAATAMTVRERGGGVRPNRVVTGRRGGDLRDSAHADRVVVAPGQQRLSRGRAERSRVEPVVLEAVGSQALGVGVDMGRRMRSRLRSQRRR